MTAENSQEGNRFLSFDRIKMSEFLVSHRSELEAAKENSSKKHKDVCLKSLPIYYYVVHCIVF